MKQCLRAFLTSVLSEVSRDGKADKEGAKPTTATTPPRYREARGLVETPPIFVTGSANSPLKKAKEPDCPASELRPSAFAARSFSTSFPEKSTLLESRKAPRTSERIPEVDLMQGLETDPRTIFRPLEQYLNSCFASLQCLNASFMTHRRRSFSSRTENDAAGRRRFPPVQQLRKGPGPAPQYEPSMALDPKLLLLGDFAENGSWWSGGQESLLPTRAASHRTDESGSSVVNLRSPQIHWPNLSEWYDAIVHAGERWRAAYEELLLADDGARPADEATLARVEATAMLAQQHLRKALLKFTENRLKRPGRLLREPQDLRFLLIFLENPLLHSMDPRYRAPPQERDIKNPPDGPHNPPPADDLKGRGPIYGRYSNIVKRLIGLLSNASPDCHGHLASWFARYSQPHFVQTLDLVSGFLTYRLGRQAEKEYGAEVAVDLTGGLVPTAQAARGGASFAALHAELSSAARGQQAGAARKKKDRPEKKMVYQDEWQTKAAARVLGLLFNASISAAAGRRTDGPGEGPSSLSGGGDNSNRRSLDRGQMVPTSAFYNTLLDYSDLIAGFDAWESKRAKFSFCQYPFLLSIWAKIQILEHEARRQMEVRAMEAFFDSILSRKNVNQYLTLEVRRDCLVEDSLRIVSEVVGSGSEDIKKRLRVEFKGEEGIDIGGLRKEWFLLFVREVFNPDHGKSVSIPSILDT